MQVFNHMWLTRKNDLRISCILETMEKLSEISLSKKRRYLPHFDENKVSRIAL